MLRKSDDRPEFTGKVVAVYGRLSQGSGGVFEDVHIERIGPRSFLVGRYVSPDAKHQDRWSNVTGWVAVDDISRILVFDDVEAVRRAFASDDKPPELTDS